MSYDRPIILTLAGFDPSGGAGILADIKTFEQHRCMGMAACTALTIQTENTFQSCEWVSFERIKNTYAPLLDQYPIAYIKIGLMESIELLLKLVLDIKTRQPDSFIVWDPIVSASVGTRFMEVFSPAELQEALRWVDLITPNTNEAKVLTNLSSEYQAAEQLANHTNVLLKGGHSESEKGTDVLFEKNKTTRIPGTPSLVYEKHGSGCVLSSAIVCNIALGLSLPEACKVAKKYIESVLSSNTKLLGYHVS